MDSQWGAANIKYHYSRNMRFFIYMFTNDGETNLTANQTIDDYLTIYNFVKQNGTIPLMYSNSHETFGVFKLYFREPDCEHTIS